MTNKELLTEATIKALQEDDLQDYLDNEKELSKQYLKRVTDMVTPDVIRNFGKLKEILESGSDLTEYEGFYFPEEAINILKYTDKRHNLNGFMDLTIADILNMVSDFDTPEEAIEDMFNEYKPDSALAWGDNFVTVLSQLVFNLPKEDLDYEDFEESKKIESKVTEYIDEDELDELIKNNPIFAAKNYEAIEDMLLDVTTDMGHSFYKVIKNDDGSFEAYLISKDGKRLGDNFILKENKEIKVEGYTAREVFDAHMSKRSEEDKANIKVVSETEHYLLTVARNKENDGFYLAVTTGKTDDRMLPDVYIEQDYKGVCKTAQINWGAFGSCTAEETKQFIQYLIEATEFVESISGKDFSSEV